MEENFAQRNGWKFHRQSAGCYNPALYCFYKLWGQAVAIIESAGGRGYPNDWSAKHLARVTHRLGKGSPQVTGKLWISVASSSFIEIIFFVHLCPRKSCGRRLDSTFYASRRRFAKRWLSMLTAKHPQFYEAASLAVHP